MNWQEIIEQNPAILGGKPIFKGTRLSVEFILERLATGETPQQLLAEYPTLKESHLHAAFAFAADQLRLTRSILLDQEAV